MYKRNSLKYIGEGELYFSVFKGKGIYYWTGMNGTDPTDIRGEKRCEIFSHIETDIMFLAKKVEYRNHYYQYKRAIEEQPEVDCVMWPKDIIKLPVVGNGSLDLGNNIPALEVEQFFLYPYRAYGISRTVKDALNEIGEKSWKNPRVRQLIKSMITSLKKLNDKNYVTLDFDFAHLYIRNDQSILFPYSHLIYRKADSATELSKISKIKKEEYPLEFAEPAVMQGKYDEVDLNMQNYSLTAMIFYLMLGRYAYDGPLMAGITDTNEIEHQYRFNIYHKNPVFIFDPVDTSNHLGEFSIDKKTIELWEELPYKIKMGFIDTLGQENAERKSQNHINTTPEMWENLMALLE